MEITEPTHIPDDVLSMLRAQVVERATLEEVVRWALLRREPFPVVDVIVQDEYTHDVVIRVRGDVYLVLGSPRRAAGDVRCEQNSGHDPWTTSERRARNCGVAGGEPRP